MLHSIETAAKFIFADNIGVAILLALLCLGICYGAPFSEVVLRKVFVGEVFKLLTFAGRFYLGVPGLKRGLSRGTVPGGAQATESARAVDRYAGWLERKVSALSSDEAGVARVFFDRQGLLADLRMVEAVQIALLDTERSLLEVLSDDETRRARGVINIAANPMRIQLLDKDLIWRALFIAMRDGAAMSRHLALYHCDQFIVAPQQIAEIRQIMKTWSAAERGSATTKIDRLEASLRAAAKVG